jgi:hypothetical protein
MSDDFVQGAVQCRTFFAVQLRPKESVQEAVAAVFTAAKDANTQFRQLDVLDTVTIGVTQFARMRSDVLNPFPFLERLLSAGRGVINHTVGGAYQLRMPGGREGKISNIMMHASAKLGQTRTFRGTKIKHWERQFHTA